MKALGIVFILIALFCAYSGSVQTQSKSDQTFLKGIERSPHQDEETRASARDLREERDKSQQTLFLIAGGLGVVGLILLVSAPKRA